MTAIRPATETDVPTILRLLQDMAAETGEAIGSTEASLRAHGFGPVPRFRALLAEDDGGACGLILYFAEYSTWRGQMGLFVQDLYVGPQGRGQGLGRRFLVEAMRRADWGPEFLTLMVAQKNHGGRAFYEALGLGLRDAADQLILDGEGLQALMNS